MNKNTKCESCGCKVEYEVVEWAGKEMPPPRMCQGCFDKQKAAEDQRAERRAAQEEFFRVCPPLYRDTEIKRLPESFLEVLRTWKWGPTGVAFIGKPGMRKTRAAFLLLQAQIKQGRSVEAITATDFGMLAMDQFSNDDEKRDEACERMRAIKTAEVLLIDDVGKGKMTERAELELYALLEYRTSHMIPTIWTANSTVDELKTAMSNERGAAIIRRLKEFSKLV